MTPKHRIIIDTDPGVDDVLAMLLALSAHEDELEVLLISVTYGNVEVANCLKNVVTLFHQINLEMKWRRQNGRNEGFGTLLKHKPLVAVGAAGPLADHQLMADYFHGTDGLGGIHESHPELSATETWQSLFASLPQSGHSADQPTKQDMQPPDALFIPSKKPAHEEILSLLRENEPDTITIVAIGPSTNLAIAAATDPETFLRAKEVVVMGGAIEETGNITPVAEFNIFADTLAAARLFALTSPHPASTMPPPVPTKPALQSYPAHLSKPLNLTLFPLDITIPHALHPSTFTNLSAPLISSGSPLAIWTDAFLASTFKKLSGLYKPDAPLSLHDPLCIWYLLGPSGTMRIGKTPEDIRVETSGQWTRGMCVTDRRGRAQKKPEMRRNEQGKEEVSLDEVPGDTGNWLREGLGNAVWRCSDSDWKESFGEEMLKRIYAL